jgi:O-antigen/teichoic acid export membrane protein
MSGDRLVQHGLLLMGMAQVANLAGIVFHMVMGRALTVDEYGILGTLLNMMLVLASPLDALRNAMAHFSARAEQQGQRAVVRALSRQWLSRMLGAGLLAGLALMLAAPQVAEFFHLESTLPVRVAGGLLPVMLCAPVVAGLLQGMQSFLWMSVGTQLWMVLRLGLGYLLVTRVAATALSAVWSHALSQALGLLVALYGLTTLLRGQGRESAPAGVVGYFLQSMLLLAGYGVLMNSDLMLVRHFHPDEAGYFAQAATIGRSVIFLPMPIAMALFPKVISSGLASAESRRTLGRALAMAAVLIGMAVLMVWLLPWLPLRILYGVKEPAPELLALVRWVCLAMSPLGLSYLLLHFEMAQHRFEAVPWLIACALAYVGGVYLWHDTVLHVVAVLGGAALTSALVFAIMLVRHRPR